MTKEYKKKELKKASGKIIKGLAAVIGLSIVGAIAYNFNKSGSVEVTEGAKQLWNIGANTFHQWRENKE